MNITGKVSGEDDVQYVTIGSNKELYRDVL